MTTTAVGGPRWARRLNDDPLAWLLEAAAPAVRHRTLRELLDLPPDSAEVIEARRAAMRTDPIAAILLSQHPEGWWVKPGGGYSPKYTGTVWSLIFLDQLGADGTDPRVRAACAYLLDHAQSPSGGFGFSGGAAHPPSSTVAHCLNGNLLRAYIGFGWLDDERVQQSIAWQAAAITGDGDIRWYRTATSGPGFECAANEHLSCGWGAAKAVLALARIPPQRRTPAVDRALEVGVDFLLSVDPATAVYPMGWGNTKPNGSWFRLGFPSGYVADVLQVMEAVCEAGAGGDPRLDPAVDWLLAQQDAQGRWVNRYPYLGKMHVDIDPAGEPSRWVTLRACRVLKMIDEARRTAMPRSATTS
ncbi:MAG: nitrogen fixation protein NifH [Candidatus Limnocylindria bacterium]